MKDSKTGKEKVTGYIYYLSRVAALLSVVLIFLPACNPAKICDYVNKTCLCLPRVWHTEI